MVYAGSPGVKHPIPPEAPPWWLAGGVDPSVVVAAWHVFGKNIDDSLIDMVGSYDLQMVGSVYVEDGAWRFTGTGSYLHTPFIYFPSFTIITMAQRVSDSGDGLYRHLVTKGEIYQSNATFAIALRDSSTLEANEQTYFFQSINTNGDNIGKGVVGGIDITEVGVGAAVMADTYSVSYWNKTRSATFGTGGTPRENSYDLEISGAESQSVWPEMRVWAIAIYNTDLSEDQIFAITDALHALKNSVK